jgi:hypothetical protein
MIDNFVRAIFESILAFLGDLFTCGGWRRDKKEAAAEADLDNGQDTAA